MVTREVKARLIGVGVVALFAFLSGFLYWNYHSPAGFSVRQHSPVKQVIEGEGVAYTDLGGTSLSLDDYEGEILIVNAWASWSPFTPHEFELLRDLKTTYGDKIHILAINRMESKETANAYLDSIGRPEGVVLILDPNDHFFDTAEGYAMPETIIYDTYGRVALHKRGTLEKDELVPLLDTLTED